MVDDSNPVTTRQGGVFFHQHLVPRHPVLERLICAALCNPRLAGTLLTSPAVALGSSNDAWRLTAAERALVLAVTDASDLYDFAGQLHTMAARASQGVAAAAWAVGNCDGGMDLRKVV